MDNKHKKAPLRAKLDIFDLELDLHINIKCTIVFAERHY